MRVKYHLSCNSHLLIPSWNPFICHFFTCINLQTNLALVAQIGKNPPAMRETSVQSLGWEYSLKEGMALYSSFFAWRIPWTEEPGGLQSMGSQRVGHDWATKHPTMQTKVNDDAFSLYFFSKRKKKSDSLTPSRGHHHFIESSLPSNVVNIRLYHQQG